MPSFINYNSQQNVINIDNVGVNQIGVYSISVQAELEYEDAMKAALQFDLIIFEEYPEEEEDEE